MLIDANIFLEITKDQAKKTECLDLLRLINQNVINNEEVYITKFTLHALEASISNRDFLKTILIMIYQGKIKVFDNEISDDLMILASMKDLNFDFDDATQYLATIKLDTYIITFDKSFQDKKIEVKTPAEVLKAYIKSS